MVAAITLSVRLEYERGIRIIIRVGTVEINLLVMSKKLKNWLRGATSVLQLRPDTSSKMRERFLQQSAAEALYRDWERIGSDIRTATGKYEHEGTKR